MEQERIAHDEVEAMLSVRQEQGADIESALVDSMAAKINEIVAQQTRVQQHLYRSQQSTSLSPTLRFVTALVSLVMAVPLTAIATSMVGVIGLAFVAAMVLGVNIAVNLPPHGQDRRH